MCVGSTAFRSRIELAAARVKVLSLDQIHARLHDRFRLLTGGSRTAVARQRTLEATVDWSYGLLSGAERRLLRRLSVFAGGWTMEAAEDVTSEDAIERDDVLESLSRLVDKSLVNVESDAEAKPRGITFSRPCASTRGSASSNRAKPSVCAIVIWRSSRSWLDAPSPS